MQKKFGVKNDDRVHVVVSGERVLVFDQVLIRVRDDYRLEMYVDTDEANACLLKNGQMIELRIKE